MDEREIHTVTKVLFLVLATLDIFYWLLSEVHYMSVDGRPIVLVVGGLSMAFALFCLASLYLQFCRGNDDYYHGPYRSALYIRFVIYILVGALFFDILVFTSEEWKSQLIQRSFPHSGDEVKMFVSENGASTVFALLSTIYLCCILWITLLLVLMKKVSFYVEDNREAHAL